MTVKPDSVSSTHDLVVVDGIIPVPEISDLIRRFRFTRLASQTESDIKTLVSALAESAEPLAAFKICAISNPPGKALKINNITFNNPLLKVNLSGASPLFCFAVSLGNKIQLKKASDSIEIYAFPILKDILLDQMVKSLSEYLSKQFQLNYVWTLIPGQMQAWPASGRYDVFTLLGDIKSKLGITLNSDFTFDPTYSSCGFCYYKEIEFEGCQICPKEPCMMRRAQYNPALASKTGLKIRKVCGRDTA